MCIYSTQFAFLNTCQRICNSFQPSTQKLVPSTFSNNHNVHVSEMVLSPQSIGAGALPLCQFYTPKVNRPLLEWLSKNYGAGGYSGDLTPYEWEIVVKLLVLKKKKRSILYRKKSF